MKSTLYAIDMSQFDDIIARLKQTDTYIIGLLETEAMPRINDMIVSQAFSNAPARTGTLRESLAAKIVKYKGGQVLVGITGVDNKVSRPGGTRIARKDQYSKRGKGSKLIRRRGDSRDVTIKPAHYFHLVELGTKFSTANPFFSNTVDSLKTQISDIFRETMEKALASTNH